MRTATTLVVTMVLVFFCPCTPAQTGVDGTLPATTILARRNANTTHGFSNAVPLGIPQSVPPNPALIDASGASSARDISFDERLSKLEAGWAKLDSAWSDLAEAEAKSKKDAASKPTFKIGGRIHADYWSFVNTSQGVGFLENPVAALPSFGQDPEDLFKFRRVRLEAKGDIPDNMLWRIQIDFNTPDSGEMKDVYLGFKELPGNQTLLIGNQKRPMGLDALNSSRFNVFLERPFVVEAFNEDARRPGIAMYGYTDDERYHWRYGVYSQQNITHRGRIRGDTRQLSLDGRLSSSPWYDDNSGGRGYFHWGVAGRLARPNGDSAATATNVNEARFRTRPEARSTARWLNTGRIPGATWYETIAAESILNVGRTQIVGEYQHTFMQRETYDDVKFGGGYVYVSYFLTGEHIPYDRRTGTIGRVKPFENFFLVDRCSGGTGHGWGALNVAARYSWLDVTDKDITGGVGESGTLAINWFWNAYAKVQFNLIYGDIHDRGPVGGFDSGNYLIAGTRFAVEF
jgi:phosphate-selective porin OprO and OprP